MSVDIRNEYDEMKKYSETIIPEIIDVLSKNNFEYDTNSNNTEIIVNGDNDDSVYERICNALPVPKIIFPLLVDMVEVDNKIYIRQKTM